MYVTETDQALKQVAQRDVGVTIPGCMDMVLRDMV